MLIVTWREYAVMHWSTPAPKLRLAGPELCPSHLLCSLCTLAGMDLEVLRSKQENDSTLSQIRAYDVCRSGFTTSPEKEEHNKTRQSLEGTRKGPRLAQRNLTLRQSGTVLATGWWEGHL